ncbi:MAG: PocR ligand-binding domain-containing protein [Oscillospiraceae bacterium]|nr:PocR ligand-binding domain-containing protein [Oscillospiraceae bacterium]
MQNLKLTDLIDIGILQKIQDSFSEYTHMASLIADENGVPITNGSGFTRFCMDLTRNTELGYIGCMECDRMGGVNSLKTGKPSVYQCHAGLCDFAAPIIVDGLYVGSIMGGQILTKPLDENHIRAKAAEYGIDEQEYLNAAREVHMKSESDVLEAANFILKLAEILSEMAYNNYQALKASRSLEKAACSQASYIIDMNSELHKNIKNWIYMAGCIADSEDIGQIRKIISTFISEGQQFLSSIEDTVEFAKMTDGEIELVEEEYSVREAFEKLIDDEELADVGKINLCVDENVPAKMFGDTGRISQAVIKLLQRMKGIAPDGELLLSVFCPHCSYAAELEIRIGTTEQVTSMEEITEANNSFKNKNKYINVRDLDDIAMTVTGRIIKQMHGTISAVKTEKSGIEFVIKVPQLAVSEE